MNELRVVAMPAALLLTAEAAEAQGAKALKKCAPDASVSGTICIDAYEMSVWRVPDAAGANASLVKKIRDGKATMELLTAGGATQLGTAGDDYAPCDDNGQNCHDDIFAVSLPGVTPSRFVTWFQAQAACKNSRKRLPSNAEWQAAVAGTPDAGPDDGVADCNTATTFAVATGSRSNCLSGDGAYDMVGNLAEWVADWIPRSTFPCGGSWSAGISATGDTQCIVGVATTGEPGALLRGGFFSGGPVGGPFTIGGGVAPSAANDSIGGRCAR
jgi:hypothetical protein